MADRILIQCPGCSAKLAISDASKLGKKIRCSKCSEVFVAKPLQAGGSKAAKPKPKKSDDDEFNFDDMEMEDKSESEDEESAEESRPARAKSAAKKGVKAKGKGKKKSSGGNLPLIIGGSVAIVLLLGIGGYFLFRGGETPPAPAPQQPVAQAPAAAPVAAPAQPDSPNDKILALKWLPQDTELIIHLKIADVWQAPLLKGLLSLPQVAEGIAQMQQTTGLVPADLESVTIGLRNLEQLQVAGMMMAMGRPPPTDAPMLVVVRSKKAVEIAKLQQLIVQSIPNQAARIADHNGKSYIEATLPSPGPPRGFGSPPATGAPAAGGPPRGFAASGSGAGQEKPSGVWFADANTLILGPREELFGAMDRGQTVTPRNEFRAIDASSQLLIVVAPKNPTSMMQTAPPTIPGMPPAVSEMLQALQKSMTAVSVGVSVRAGVDLQSSFVFKDSAGSSKVKPGVDALVVALRQRLSQNQSTTPPLLFELGEMLLNNAQVTEQSQVAKIATSIPDSAQQKLEQLPAIVMGMMAFAGSPFAGGGNPFAAAGNAAGEAQAKNNLKQILLAFHNYQDTTKSFPPAYNVDSEEKPLLSWRVHILPNFGEAELYKQFHLNEPWDSEHNKSLIPLMPATYASSDDAELKSQGRTRYLVPYGLGMAFEGKDGIQISDFSDGTSNTIMALEVAADAAVVWTKPEDLLIDLNEPFRNLSASRGDHFLVVLAEGSVRVIKDSVVVDTLKALFTRKGRDVPGSF